MDFDVESHLGAVERSASALQRGGLPAQAAARRPAAFYTGEPTGDD